MVGTNESGLMEDVDPFPFMLHVLVALVVTYLFLPFSLNGFFFILFILAYLFEVDRRGRERERRRIASEEWRKINTKRTFDEGETLRWLNQAIKSMWPVCMETFASKHLFSHMLPWFLKAYKPRAVSDVKIETLHLGSTPPVFNLIRTLERPTGGDHVVFESNMDFNSGDDMNCKMSVLLKSLGLRTTFYISRLHVEGTVRISVKFLESWPVVGRLRLCFTSKPLVSMSYRPMDKNGIDVSLIPVIANVVEKMVDNALELSVVEPNLLIVDIEKLVSHMFSDSRAQQGLSRFFKVENEATLVVEILEASNLKAADSNGLSDPFVDINFGQRHQRTSKKKKTLNPKWENERYEFPIVSWDMPNLLTLRVRDWDILPTISSHELGICSVSVNDYRNGERHVFNKRLEKVLKGHLKFAISVVYSHPPQMAEEPRISDAMCETVSQDLKTSSSAVDYISPTRVPGMPRSKSDTNLPRIATSKVPVSRHRRRNSSGDSALSEVFGEQKPHGDKIDFIDMPYGPRGAFTIFHPGLQTPLLFTPARDASKASETDKSGEFKQSRRYRWIRRMRKQNGGNNSLEGLQTDGMSEQSCFSGSSADFSTDLRDFNPDQYRGPVKMNLEDVEPPLMDMAPSIVPIHVSGQLEPIQSGKTPTTPAINQFFGNAPRDTFAPAPGEVDSRPSPVSGGSNMETTSILSNEEGHKGEGIGDAAFASSQPVQRLRTSPKRQSGKPSFSLPSTWYKKMRLLAKRSKKKKRNDKGEVAFSSELKYPVGEYAEGDHRAVSFYHEDSDQSFPSGPQTFIFESPLETRHMANAGNPGNAQVDSPQQRLIINSSSSSAANSGSQSDRHWASKVKRLIPDKLARTSQSFRHEFLDLKRLQTPIRDSSLTTIPERSSHHRNAKPHV
ncbi:uncharacterized protein [Physcomitrium patens]|uniref:C2 domain-containing protein n=1 Tax=Physcomitrium patens TaxID=3218 RepID=A0A2K1J9X6_PHYPA|nr:uncharacterized protein LOC112293610 [Physcomitrium patens]PNR38333.1 hypothetical protein PHYPA_021444 [Physcomitrium patens]|eukprot:XP_024399018.1 uncharacterized protein LOC112293610 [Physcomitrella patens]